MKNTRSFFTLKAFLLYLAVLFAFLCSLAYPALTFASDSDASASADIKAKIETLKQEIASRAMKLKDQISEKLQNKAYIGFIKSKSDTSITLAALSGPKIITVNDFTNYTGKGRVSLKTLNANDYIAALGDIDDNDVLTARKVIKLTAPEKAERQTIFGGITGVADQTFTLHTLENQSLNVSVDDNTNIKLENSEGTFSKIKAGTSLIVVGTSPQPGDLEARFIYIPPQNSFTSIKLKLASKSAETSPAGQKKEATPQAKQSK